MRRPAPSARPAQPLSRERIADVAMSLIDADGLEAFSTRHLGTALGCEAMSIYHYFPSKGELLDAVASRVLDEVALPPPASGGWRRRLRVLLDNHMEVARRHPEPFTLLALRRLNTPEAFRFMEYVFGCLAEAGFDAEMRATMFRLVGQWATGAALSALATSSAVRHSTPHVSASAMDSTRYPLTTETTPYLMPSHFTVGFEFCAEAILDAVEAAPRRHPGRRPPRAKARRPSRK